MELNARYFGVISCPDTSGKAIRKRYNKDSVEEILEIYKTISENNFFNLIGIVDLDTFELVYPEIIDEDLIKGKLEIINLEYDTATQSLT